MVRSFQAPDSAVVSSETSPFDRAHMTSYLTSIDSLLCIYLVLFSSYSAFFVESGEFLPTPFASSSNFAVNFGVRQLESRAIVWHYLCDPMFSHFDTIPECNDTHTRTDGRTHDDGIYRT